MAGNFKVSMTLTAKDEASPVLEKGQKQVNKAASEAAKAVSRVSNEQKKSNEQSTSSTKKAISEIQRATRAREAIGIRSEREIRREIALTIASYNRLARKGFESAREQERAMQATREKARALKRELDGVSQAQNKIAKAPEVSRMTKAATLGRNILTVGGGIAAATAVVSQPVKRQMSYERQLAMMANTAFSDGGLEGRKAGLEKMKNSIRTAVTYGGGTKEEAAETLDALLKDGISFETANKWLPDLMKYATASGASATDLANVMIKGKKTFGFMDEDISTVLNMAIAAGKEGSFELNDMARWLSAQMGAASAAGMTGMDDFTKLLALNEAAGITAGSSDEAGNNVVNLLAKLTSKDIENAAKGIDINGKGIDLPGTLAEARKNGLDPVETLSEVIDKIVTNDKRYQDLQKKLASVQDKGEQKAVFESMAKILEGFGVGKLVADRQALMALLAYRNNPEYRKKVEDAINQQRTLPEGQRVGDVDFTFMSGLNDFKVEQAKNTLELAQMDGVKKISDVSGSVAEAISFVGKEFPELTTAVTGATTAIQAMTAAAVAFAGLKFITDAAGISGAKGSAGEGIPKKSPRNSSRWKQAGKALGKFAAAYTLYDPVDSLLGAAVGEENKQWMDEHGLFISDDGSWHFSREAMTKRNNALAEKSTRDKENTIDNDLPSPEQVSGLSGARASDAASLPNLVTQPSYLTHWGPPASPINITTQLVLDGHVVAESVNHHNVLDANRGTGGTN